MQEQKFIFIRAAECYFGLTANMSIVPCVKRSETQKVMYPVRSHCLSSCPMGKRLDWRSYKLIRHILRDSLRRVFYNMRVSHDWVSVNSGNGQNNGKKISRASMKMNDWSDHLEVTGYLLGCNFSSGHSQVCSHNEYLQGLQMYCQWNERCRPKTKTDEHTIIYQGNLQARKVAVCMKVRCVAPSPAMLPCSYSIFAIFWPRFPNKISCWNWPGLFAWPIAERKKSRNQHSIYSGWGGHTQL